MRNAIALSIVCVLAACGVEPRTSSVPQDLCQLDPTTGRCRGYIVDDPVQEAQQQVADYDDANYPSITPTDQVTCSRGSTAVTCGVALVGHHVSCVVRYESWCGDPDCNTTVYRITGVSCSG